MLYPGGKWQYFAEWSGLDEQAAAEEKEGYDSYSYGGGVGGVDGRMSSYDDDGDGFSSGRKKAAAAAVRDAAAARARAPLPRRTKPCLRQPRRCWPPGCAK